MKGPSFGLGPLDALHAHIIEGKALDTPASWGAYVLAPVLPLLLSAYLLVGKNAAHTRRWRIALGVIGTLGAAHSFVSFRCTGVSRRSSLLIARRRDERLQHEHDDEPPSRRLQAGRIRRIITDP
jgi:hypothetical protein